MDTKKKQLTWADVKVGEVFNRRDVGIGYKMTDNYCLWEDGTSSEAGTIKNIEYVYGDFHEIGGKLNLEYPGFTIPDDVVNPEKIINPKPKGKPAVEYKPGEWLQSESSFPMLRTVDGVFFRDEYRYRMADNDHLRNMEHLQDCIPCEPAFEIVPVEEMKELRDLFKEVKELRNAVVSNDDPDTSEDSAPEDDAVGELIERACRSEFIPSDLATKARDQYERMKNISINSTRAAFGIPVEATPNNGQWLSDVEISNLQIKHHMEGWTDCLKDLEDGELDIKPTIPQEVRNCLNTTLDFLQLPYVKDSLKSFGETQLIRNKIKDTLNTLDRCEVSKPHPLTKVRELVEFITSRTKYYSAATFNCGNDSLLVAKLEAARRELEEYDGEATDE